MLLDTKLKQLLLESASGRRSNTCSKKGVRGTDERNFNGDTLLDAINRYHRAKRVGRNPILVSNFLVALERKRSTVFFVEHPKTEGTTVK
jgi:hypothetical protein